MLHSFRCYAPAPHKSWIWSTTAKWSWEWINGNRFARRDSRTSVNFYNFYWVGWTPKWCIWGLKDVTQRLTDCTQLKKEASTRLSHLFRIFGVSFLNHFLSPWCLRTGWNNLACILHWQWPHLSSACRFADMKAWSCTTNGGLILATTFFTLIFFSTMLAWKLPRLNIHWLQQSIMEAPRCVGTIKVQFMWVTNGFCWMTTLPHSLMHLSPTGSWLASHMCGWSERISFVSSLWLVMLLKCILPCRRFMLFSMLPEWSFTLLSLIARLLMWLPKLSQMRPPFWCGNSADFGHMKKVREKKMDCFGTYFTHVQTCDDVRVQSATEWTASVHILYTCPNLQTSKCRRPNI